MTPVVVVLRHGVLNALADLGVAQGGRGPDDGVHLAGSIFAPPARATARVAASPDSPSAAATARRDDAGTRGLVNGFGGRR
jgi:hypothetical protein